MAKFNLKKFSFFRIAFWVLAFVFLALGLGTLGSVQSTGNAYELIKSPGTDSAQTTGIIFKLSNITETDEEGNWKSTTYLRLKHVYVNVACLYSEEGTDVGLRLNRGASSTNFPASSSYRFEAKLENLQPAELDEGGESTAVRDSQFNWVAPFDEALEAAYQTSHVYMQVNSYPYYQLTATTDNLLINEIVFVGEVLTEVNGKETGELVVIPAEIYDAKPHNNEIGEEAMKRAGALIDAQNMPNLAQSSFSRFTREEARVMMTLAEMRQGNSYSEGNVYHGDTVYNTLGISILALGTLMFGMSPFGLRFFPMLASFGVLVIGYLLCKDMFRSERAGFVFALLYALCNFSFGLGHLGTPLQLGVFFFVTSLFGAYRFYSRGMKKANFQGALPLILSGLCGAAAICVNGAFLVPVAGIVGLFAAGLVRQQKARRYHLDKAIAEAEEEDALIREQYRGKPAGEIPAGAARQTVANVVTEYRNKNMLAPVAFFTSLVAGALFFTLVFLVPVYFAAVKFFDNPASPALNIFGLSSQFFAGGYTGANAAGWTFIYETFRGAGETYAVTALVMNFVAILAGLLGIAFAIWRIVVICKDKNSKKSELRSVCVLLSALLISLITAAFAKGTVAFLFLAYVFAFMLGSACVRYFTETEGKLQKPAKIISYVGAGLLGAWFLLLAVFTFSIPLSAGFVVSIFG